MQSLILKANTRISRSVVIKGFHTILENLYIRILRYTVVLTSFFTFTIAINLQEQAAANRNKNSLIKSLSTTIIYIKAEAIVMTRHNNGR